VKEKLSAIVTTEARASAREERTVSYLRFE